MTAAAINSKTGVISFYFWQSWKLVQNVLKWKWWIFKNCMNLNSFKSSILCSKAVQRQSRALILHVLLWCTKLHKVFIPSRHNGVPLRVPYVYLDIETFFSILIQYIYWCGYRGECTFFKSIVQPAFSERHFMLTLDSFSQITKHSEHWKSALASSSRLLNRQENRKYYYSLLCFVTKNNLSCIFSKNRIQSPGNANKLGHKWDTKHTVWKLLKSLIL